MHFKYMYNPVRIVFGKGALNKLHSQNLPGKKALIVTSTGKSIKKHGYLARVEKELELAGVSTVLFDRIRPNPLEEHVMEGSELARKEACDFIVGLGGASSIDSAKSIALMTANTGNYWDYINGGTGLSQTPENKPLPVVVIATTVGSGTAANSWTFVTRRKTKEKIGFRSDHTYPVLSLVDTDLLATLSHRYTAFQAFCTLLHCAEGYIAQNDNPICDALALEGLNLISRSLPTAVRNSRDEDAMSDLAYAGLISGYVESMSSCLSEHSMAYALSAHYPNVPHGAGLIMISQAYYTYFAQKHACDGKLVRMAKILGKPDARHPMDFVYALCELQSVCEVDSIKMSDFGIDRTDFPKIARTARDTMGSLFLQDPAELSEDDCISIYDQSYR